MPSLQMIVFFLELSEDNFGNALNRLNFFCFASARIVPHKSIVLGSSDVAPNWVISNGCQWNGPNTIVGYLGISFAVEPSKDMWLWIYDKIERKHLKRQ